MAADVAMSDAAKPAEAVDAKAPPAEEPPADVLTLLKRNAALLEKSVSTKETRFTARALRQTTALRKRLDNESVTAFVKAVLPEGTPSRPMLLGYLEAAAAGMEVDAAGGAAEASGAGGDEGAPGRPLPEVEVYASLVAVLLLLDSKAPRAAHGAASAAVARAAAFKRRSLDALTAKLYFAYAVAAEAAGSLAAARGTLLALHRTASLRHDDAGQEVLVNALLRSHLLANQVEAAEQLRSKLAWPEKHSNAQYCRYLYYLGRIRAVQLAYSDAKECLQQAARKAPPPPAAPGFRAQLTKWLVVVRLLLGEIPERLTFRQEGIAAALAPYFELTNAVRTGDLAAFAAVSAAHAAVFAADGLAHLIVRLRRNVIRTGLRRINASYSRISLADVAAKLGLAGAEDAECIVAKAIRDGGMDARIDAAAGVVLSTPVAGAYAGGEPAEAFHARTTFCLDLHNEAVQGLRFPPDAHKGALESAEARRERLAQEAELAQHIAEDGGGMDDDF